jgi:hypothetical protein
MELFRKDIPLLLKLNEREQKEQKITVTVHLKESTSPLHSKVRHDRLKLSLYKCMG